VAEHVAAAHEASVEVTFHDGYPSTDNDRDAARFMGEVMQRVVGESNAVLDVQPAMTAEDFSFMLLRVPGAYGFLGNGPKGGAGIPLHSANYDFNDSSISIGVRFWDALARDWFRRRALD
jgi:hippurate hydrolase